MIFSQPGYFRNVILREGLIQAVYILNKWLRFVGCINVLSTLGGEIAKNGRKKFHDQGFKMAEKKIHDQGFKITIRS